MLHSDKITAGLLYPVGQVSSLTGPPPYTCLNFPILFISSYLRIIFANSVVYGRFSKSSVIMPDIESTQMVR